MKVCMKCRKVKLLDQFCFDKNRRSGRYLYCKECVNAYMAKWRARSKDKIRRKSQRYNRGIRTTLMRGYGGCCTCCGEAVRSMLDLDHVDPALGRHQRSVLGWDCKRVYLDAIESGFPSRYQLLCSNCNQSKRRVGQCEHGTLPDQTKGMLGACLGN